MVPAMQASFVRFDNALIEHVFQPLTDLITGRIGLDRLRVVGICLDAASIAWILSQADALTHAVTQWDAGASFLRMLLLLLGLVALTSLRLYFIAHAFETVPIRCARLCYPIDSILALLAARLVALTGFARHG